LHSLIQFLKRLLVRLPLFFPLIFPLIYDTLKTYKKKLNILNAVWHYFVFLGNTNSRVYLLQQDFFSWY
jgi:hypothetical protein